MKHISFKSKKMWTFVACVLIVMITAVSLTFSYLISKTDTKVNEFVPAEVSCAVEESFDGSVKQNVVIKNTGNVDAYIRATLIVTYVDENDESRVLGTAPVQDRDYSVVWGDSAWTKGTDGLWYYSGVLAPDDVTAAFVNRIEPIGTAPDGYRLSVQILASAIQAQPVSVVAEQWGVTVQNNGKITPN